MITYRENLTDMISGAPVMPYSLKLDLFQIVNRISAATCKTWTKYIVSGARFFYDGYAQLSATDWLSKLVPLLMRDFGRGRANSLYRSGYVFNAKDFGQLFESIFPREYKKSRHKYINGRRIY